MVNTRACTMNSEKGKRNQNKNSTRSRANNPDSGNEKSKMKSNSKSPPSICSNPESEEDDQNVPTAVTNPPVKVTLKKTRSNSSSSSRESTQSFEVVRSLTNTTESVSGEEDCENPKDSGQENPSDKSPSVDAGENEKESDGESQNANSSDDSDVEILSDDSDVSFAERPRPAVSVKAEEKNVSINTVVDLKTEELPQNSTAVKKEECKIRIKPLKEELLKEPDLEGDVSVLKHDNEIKNIQVPQPQNGIQNNEIKEQVKEQKFKLNVRSFDDLIDPRTAILINMPPPAQIERAPNFLTQNGVGPFPPPYLSCDVCGMQYDSPELLNDHKINMKHFKCSFKECEHLVASSQQEFLEHQRMVHNSMPSPVQQLAHQVQRLPAMGFDQLQSGVPPLPENLSPSMYTQPLRMPNQPVPMQRAMRPMMRPMSHNMVSPRGRNVQRGSTMRGRTASLNSSPRGSSLKRPLTAPRRGTPPMKRTNLDRNSYISTLNKTPQIAKSIAESLTKSATKNSASPASQQDVVNLFSKRGLTISTVDNGNNSILPPGLSLNSAVSIIPTSPHKSVDCVDLTGPDKPKKYYPCEICSKTYTTAEKLYEHTSIAHKSNSIPFRCNLCTFVGQSPEALNRHKLTVHKSEMNNTSFVIPVVDLNKPSTVNKLRNLGVTSYIPVSQLDNQSGQFGVPIMSFGKKSNLLDGMNATNFFNLGTIRHMQ
ncbi:dual specificity protein kinase splA isoform X2 [Acyrthosiphon pisum]|uniref:C2H2-type domain-containing protein n=1 Tax=Acyrthosiphon pisum TaxID=7029 RepID=A0A8R1W4H7_ACYPI|nr:dual specificity protein kinase splA isoform X2 [Acyrthosiphon pisum]|eukprot:XP_001949742.2 PREDICTED: dual specificity protein kinase splA isoform X2 [Acyrthosiphon pisum]